MWNAAKIVLGVAFGLLIFTAAVVIEAMTRNQFRASMKIDGIPINNVVVTGTCWPDFPWVGKAWKIDIQSDKDLELRLDSHSYVVPKGSHTVYSNHDHTNTMQYGDRAFWTYPESVEIHALDSSLEQNRAITR